jgi:glycosyltransferase involved in cell wall biosynthesis
MDFSIVVPFYNAETHIERCAQALLAQSVASDRYEIIMVDNNSTDSSAAIVRRMQAITVLNEPEQGSYAARNRGVSVARGEIVAFTDPDCVPREDWLEEIGRAMSNPDVGLVLGDRQFASDSGILGVLAAYESALCAYMFQNRRADCYYAYTNNMAVRMSILKTLGGFEQISRGGDTEFLRRVAARYGEPALAYAPGMMVRHLEIEGVGDYLRKKSIYGNVNRNAAVSPVRALPVGTRMKLALQLVRSRGGSPAAALEFLAVLAAGAIRFDWERRKRG